MLLRQIIPVLFTLACIHVHAQLQPCLKGRVIDAADSSGIAYASVFISEANIGTTTDSTGEFYFNDIPGVTLKLIVSCVGYKPLTAYVNIYDAPPVLAMERNTGTLQPVVIIGTQTQLQEESVSSVTVLDQHTMRARGALSISDGVARLPGVTQLNTGVGISKPVIRGLYGNRIQSVVMGMRFDNQQWQDEHGLGLQDIGVDRVEVIKGPMSLVYGSEAMGGVLNIIEEGPANVNSMDGDASLRVFSNTFGVAADAGIKMSKDKFFFRVRSGSESHADYSDGNNKRIVNSRFDGHVAKATIGFNRANWSCVNNYLFSKSDFGFIMDTASYLAPGGRLDRSFENPHHTVFINLFTTQNTLYFERTICRLNLGGHINRRMEDEGGGGTSLDMQLITASLHFQVEYLSPSEKWTLLNGIQSQYQQNTNFGWRKIVPDALIGEASVYSFIRYVSSRTVGKRPFVFESGVRFDLRSITTHETGTLNAGQYALPAVSRLYKTVNGSAGISVPFAKVLTWRMNVTTGYRSPNLAELSSNGVHEGTLRYEIGNVDMNIEQNFCGEASLRFDRKQFSITAAAYYNYFRDYIYLVPTSEEWFGFRVYRFIQTDATLKGIEASVQYTPVKWLSLEANYATIRATTGEGNYLPFIPADRADAEAILYIKDRGRLHGTYFRAGMQYYFPQDRPAQFETATADYGLLDAGAGTIFLLSEHRSMQVDVTCNNILNKVYYDHLSRFKEFGIYNIGRNITLNLKYKW